MDNRLTDVDNQYISVPYSRQRITALIVLEIVSAGFLIKLPN